MPSTASAGPLNGAAKSVQMLVLPAVSFKSHQINPSNCIRDTSRRFCVTDSRPGQGMGGFPTARTSLARLGRLSWRLARQNILPFAWAVYSERPPKSRGCRPALGCIQIAPHSRRRHPSALAGTCQTYID